MIKFFQTSILVLLMVTCLMIGLSYGAGTCNVSGKTGTSPYTADSASRNDVQGCLTAASRGEKVIIPEETVTWDGTVSYSKALIIQGAGIGKTIIKNGQTKCALSTCELGQCTSFLLVYTAASEAAATADLPYRNEITGITFDMQYQGLGVRFRNRYATFPLTQIRVHDNSFINCWDCAATTSDPLSSALEFYGKFEGSVDNNSFYGWPYISNQSDGADSFNYAAQNVEIGSEHAMYYEDNYIESDGTTSITSGEPFLLTTDNGTKVVTRYNEFQSKRTWTNLYKPFSPHHPVASINAGGKLGEFYGNYLVKNNNSGTWSFARPRSGYNLVFNNRIVSPNVSMQWTLYNPSVAKYRPVTTTTACGSDTLWNGVYNCDPTGQPQHVYKSYQWNNLGGLTGNGSPISWTYSGVSSYTYGGSTRSGLREDTEYFNYPLTIGTFDGTTGVGCGTAAAMAAITPTKTGVGFWVPNATLDPTATSCSDLTGWTGRNNVKAASVNGNIGVLYRWSGSDWVQYYQPYTYPHPLRGNDTVVPTNVLVSVCSGADCTTPLGCSGTATVVITVIASDNVSVSGVKACLENGTTCVSGTAYANRGLSFTNTTGSTWVLTLEDIECDGSFAYNIKSIDSSGNESANLIAAFDTEANTDITNPTLDTVVFDGTNLTLTFSEAVKDNGTYANSQWTFTADATPISITCIESWNSDQLICTPASCVDKDATLLLDYNQPVTDDAITDIAGNPLADITDKEVTNNGTADCGTPTTVSLWPHDAAPSVTSTSDRPSNLGLEFSSSTGGHISQGCFYKHADMDGQTHIWSLWRDGVELAQKTFTEEPESGWICQALDSNIEILPSTSYRISLHTSGNYYVRTGSYFANEYKNGSFTVPATGGKYMDSVSVAYPTNNTTTNLWVDFIFVPTGSSTWTVTVSNVSAAGYKCNVGATRIVDNGNATDVEVEVANGWKASFSGCGSGSTVQDGNEYTYTTAEITEDCTVEVTCAERYSPLWLKP